MHHIRAYKYYGSLLTWQGNSRKLERLNEAIAGNIDWLHDEAFSVYEPEMPCRAQVHSSASEQSHTTHCQRAIIALQIENGPIDGQVAGSKGYEPLSLTDLSGLFLVSLGAYALAVVALLLERMHSKWSGTQSVTTSRQVELYASEWQFTAERPGVCCALSVWLQSRVSDAAYRDVIAALSTAAAFEQADVGADIPPPSYLPSNYALWLPIPSHQLRTSATLSVVAGAGAPHTHFMLAR